MIVTQIILFVSCVLNAILIIKMIDVVAEFNFLKDEYRNIESRLNKELAKKYDKNYLKNKN